AACTTAVSGAAGAEGAGGTSKGLLSSAGSPPPPKIALISRSSVFGSSGNGNALVFGSLIENRSFQFWDKKRPQPLYSSNHSHSCPYFFLPGRVSPAASRYLSSLEDVPPKTETGA